MKWQATGMQSVATKLGECIATKEHITQNLHNY